MEQSNDGKTRQVLPSPKPGNLDDLGTRLELAKPAGRLVIHKGPRAGTVFAIRHSTSLIGREEGKNHIVLSWDNSVHRENHAAIEWRNDRFTLHDMQGRNPVMINGRPITRPTELRHG